MHISQQYKPLLHILHILRGGLSPECVLSNCSMAVLFLREASLPCTEQQTEALTNRLSRPEAFGPVSTWGPEVFTEIGTLAGTVEHNIPGGMPFFCDQMFLMFFFSKREVEMTALGWIGTIKNIPKGIKV